MIDSAAPTGSKIGIIRFSSVTMLAVAMSGSGRLPGHGSGIANQRTFLPSDMLWRRSCAVTVTVGMPPAGKIALCATMSPSKVCTSGSGA